MVVSKVGNTCYHMMVATTRMQQQGSSLLNLRFAKGMELLQKVSNNYKRSIGVVDGRHHL